MNFNDYLEREALMLTILKIYHDEMPGFRWAGLKRLLIASA